MRKICILALAIAAACGGSSTSQYVATLNSSNETALTTPSSGTGDATYTVDGTTVRYTINYSNLNGAPIAAHIHAGASGVAGPVVVPFSGLPTTTSGSWSGTFDPTSIQPGTGGTTTIATFNDLIAAFKAGNAYTNIHTSVNKGGEIRGQIKAK